MTLKIYYDEIDGELQPKWAMLPSYITEHGMLTYNVEGPFERFYPEDFHDELRLLSVSQGALTQCPFYDSQFDIDLNQLKLDLQKNEQPPDAVYEVDYFIVLVDDLEELLEYDVIKRFTTD